jgi:ornithine cyclodeaminase
MTRNFISYEDVADRVDWGDVMRALEEGHHRPKAQLGDLFLGPAEATLLTRSAFIEGLGYGTKSVTVMAANAARGLPSIQGAMMVYDPDTGALTGVIDSKLVTECKTAGDSILGARLLARADSAKLLIVGAGVLAHGLVRAYAAAFPALEEIAIWARRPEQAAALVEGLSELPVPLRVAEDLASAVGVADIVSTATMAREPVIQGDWLRPGTHLDLIGAFKADMREADDTALGRGRLFVDSRDTTLDHIGELKIPLATGAITRDDVLGDLYDLVPGKVDGRLSDTDITIYKNGGGAHLDLMTAAYLTSLV